MKYFFIFLIISITANLYPENKCSTFFSAQIGNKKIEIVGQKKSNKKFDDNKILLLKDNKEKILDSINIYYPDTNYRGSILLSKDAFALRISLRISIKEPYRNCFIYSNSRITNFCFYDCSRWVADGILLDDCIIYSTEFDNNTIKKIDLSNNCIYSYDGYYPNVTIYEFVNNSILGVFEYEGKWYEIYKDFIKKSTKQYKLTKHSIYENFFDKN
ncbi:hypothetical protein [Treponema sp. Marseille-Q3903]|uniref:hypothetical protein n=1 Tax=Treponema sp. Marseille-Q3903 TaxID=2766703 RepID=UPI0016521235|nr:hypothetical protein [Treponema sp. Marseille-Q3903]MBC6712393.1 hypothetical protein [Treponema sp. Marseille-Q3903]